MLNSLACDNQLEHLTCGSNEVHVWRVSIEDQMAHLGNLLEILSQRELHRMFRFAIPSDRDRYTVCRATLKLILARYLDVTPEKICFWFDTNGKPQLQKERGLVDVRFSVSHSEDLALFSVSLGRETGVDIEWIRPALASQWIAERFFPADEVKYLGQLKGISYIDGFFRCWTRMEAYLKALGQGLAGVGKFTDYDRLAWSLYDLNLGTGYTGSLAVQGHDHRIVYYDLFY